MALSADRFVQEFNRFKTLIQRGSGGQNFVSFQEGLPAEWEGYKPLLREHALSTLEAGSWTEALIGTGQILEAAIRAIEINDASTGLRNNLVRWENRFGHASRSHHAFIDARDDEELRHRLEEWLVNFFQSRIDDPTAFEQLRKIAGNRYDLAAYLFFLKDSEKYMPIAPSVFDEAFVRLGIDLVTRMKCSWANYESYILALFDVRDALRDLAGLPNARLIDAHSFCWMIARLDEAGAPSSTARQSATRRKKDPGRIYDAREKSIYEMASSVQNTVNSSQGQTVERTIKNKDLLMSREALMGYIKQLLEKQENRCALTGIPLQFRGEQEDDQLLPSLDRIDSSGHYEEGNLQVVCRFINFWKSDTDNEEFLRLLALVRDEDE